MVLESYTASKGYYMAAIAALENQRSPLRINDTNVPLEDIAKCGVLVYKLTMDSSWEATLEQYCNQKGMKHRDVVKISPTHMPDFQDKLKIFFEEHLHLDPEVRLILEGSGYFDIRDSNDKWVRIPVAKGDLLWLPAGIYHRFTTDHNDFIVAMRLFRDEPKWTAYNRNKSDTDDMEERKKYISEIA